jgi:hypothetical protein
VLDEKRIGGTRKRIPVLVQVDRRKDKFSRSLSSFSFARLGGEVSSSRSIGEKSYFPATNPELTSCLHILSLAVLVVVTTTVGPRIRSSGKVEFVKKSCWNENLINLGNLLLENAFGGNYSRLHGAFFMCVSMSNKPFDAEACDIGGQASATNGLTDATNGLWDMKNAPCTRPLNWGTR